LTSRVTISFYRRSLLQRVNVTLENIGNDRQCVCVCVCVCVEHQRLHAIWLCSFQISVRKISAKILNLTSFIACRNTN
jgi:hypothetical protein